eukprot:UN24719
MIAIPTHQKVFMYYFPLNDRVPMQTRVKVQKKQIVNVNRNKIQIMRTTNHDKEQKEKEEALLAEKLSS